MRLAHVTTLLVTVFVSACGQNAAEKFDSGTRVRSMNESLNRRYSAPRVCPQGYAGVAGVEKKTDQNGKLGVPGFCISKFEMKHPVDNDGRFVIDRTWNGEFSWRPDLTSKPKSSAQSRPWVLISFQEAKDACQRISEPDFDFSLISSSEWNIVADNISNTQENWSGGRVGVGVLVAGFRILDIKHPDDASYIRNTYCAWKGDPRGYCPAPLAVSEIWNDHSDLSTSAGAAGDAYFQQRRTHMLSNGQTVWDFGGNVSEWVIPTLGTNSPFARGGNFADVNSGIYSELEVNKLPDDVGRRLHSTDPRQPFVGFRCVAHVKE